MNRLNVKRIETVICCIGVSVACIAVFMFFMIPILQASEPMRDELYTSFGKWALIYPGILLLLSPITCQFIIGGIFFKKNKGLYGFWCVFPTAIFEVFMGGYDGHLLQSIVSSILGLILSIYAAKISGFFFEGFNSPVESLNWREKTLSVSYETPKIWVVVFDLLILVNIFVIPVMLSKFTIDNYMMTGAITFLCLVYLYSLLMLRKERLSGVRLFILIHIGVISFYAFNYKTLYVAYYIDPYFVIKKIGNILFFIGPLGLIIYNRKRLEKQ